MLTAKQEVQFRKYLKRMVNGSDKEAEYQIFNKWYGAHLENLELTKEEKTALAPVLEKIESVELANLLSFPDLEDRKYQQRKNHVIRNYSFKSIKTVYEKVKNHRIEFVFNEVLRKRKITFADVETQLTKCVKLLTEELKEFKKVFIEKRIEWAEMDYKRLSKYFDWKHGDWLYRFGVTKENKHRGGFYKVLDSGAQILRVESKRASTMTIEEFLKEAEKEANQYFEQSIYKLADRICRTDLDIDKLTLETTSLGVNFNTHISDGKTTLHARTIIAHGEIIKPHYRYIIT